MTADDLFSRVVFLHIIVDVYLDNSRIGLHHEISALLKSYLFFFLLPDLVLSLLKTIKLQLQLLLLKYDLLPLEVQLLPLDVLLLFH